MLVIWIVLAIVLVVMVAGGFVGRSRAAQRKAESEKSQHHPQTHHGKGARNHRGRGSH
jgi:hypothetical protein